jgi:hypothetical protein
MLDDCIHRKNGPKSTAYSHGFANRSCDADPDLSTGESASLVADGDFTLQAEIDSN